MSEAEMSDMLDDLLGDESDQLSQWEIEFIESLDKQRSEEGREWSLSGKQAAKLADIWDKVLG